jgi:valyl-tRNA synthetase
MLGDTAICLNPNDERYTHLKGWKARVPLIDREIPIIFDEYVDIEFGTGALKVTPAHDVNDYNLGKKHQLEIINILDEMGKLNANAQLYIGEDRFVVRKKISKELASRGLLEKTEDIKNNVGYSERTDAVIEPRVSVQWFVDMKKFMEMNPEVLTEVLNDNITIYPPKFKNTYRHWLENIKDWCISRQLWWGQRIPAYFLPSGEFVVAKTFSEAVNKFKGKGLSFDENHISQDSDVLDTWFSSWLWPISVFDGFKDPNNADIKYYYPTNDLVTAPEILFFWVARMIMAGYEFKKEKPFKNVYLTGIVRDKLGRKMSKSLGNSPDPVGLIEKYGADGVRIGMLLSSPAGNDLLFDEKLCEQGRNFSNKIWNAFRLIKGWKMEESQIPNENAVAIEWFNAKFNTALSEMEDHFSKYRLSDALMTMYKLVWDDFCSWYLEIVKPPFEQAIDSTTYHSTVEIFQNILKIIHPFMPFLSEELWHEIKERGQKDCVIIAEWPKVIQTNSTIIQDVDIVFEAITNIRNIRNSKQIARQAKLKVLIKTSRFEFYNKYASLLDKLAILESTSQTQTSIDGAASFIIKADEFFIPIDGEIDKTKEKENQIQELEYTRGFLISVEKKLSNERFVNSAPASVVEIERQKKADAEAKIRSLEESIQKL